MDGFGVVGEEKGAYLSKMVWRGTKCLEGNVMDTDENPCKLPSTDKPPATPKGSAGRARIILAAIAFVTFGLIWFSVSVTVLVSGPSVVAAFFRLPIFCLVPLIVLNTLVTAEIVVELFRLGTHWSRSWSDKRHLITVLTVWIVFFAGQLHFALLARKAIPN